MRALIAMSFLAAGCSLVQPPAPSSAPSSSTAPVAPQGAVPQAPTAAAPVAETPLPPATAKPPTEAALQPAPPAAKADSKPAPAKAPPAAAKAPVPVPVPAPATAPVAVPAPAAAPAKPAAPPPLDLTSLETRLKETRAIGVFTKLAIKNQVDDLLAKFRAFHEGKLQASLQDLRQPYEMLIMKVLSLLQDGDPGLARAVADSREAIWAILSDKSKFTRI